MKDYQIVWRGSICYDIGAGTASGEYVLALDKLGVDVKIEEFRHCLPKEDTSKTTRFQYLINKPYASDKPKILIYHYQPYDMDTKMERKKFDHIILNTVWETTKIPHHWFPLINEFDAVCVPSHQNVRALKHSGVKVPVFLIPHGADTHFFTPENEKIEVSDADGKFIFVSVFDFQHRKNPEGLLRAYWEEFRQEDHVILLIKTYWKGNGSMGSWIRENIYKYKKRLGFGNHTAPLVLITNLLEKKELSGIYTLGNAFVLPTRGEGVGLPFTEALSSGIPVITTGWGGHMDFIHEGNSFLVDYKLENPSERLDQAIAPDYRNFFAEEGQLWAEPDITSLRKQMRYAYENPSLCQRKGKQGRTDMLTYSWDRAGMALKQAVETILEEK